TRHQSRLDQNPRAALRPLTHARNVRSFFTNNLQFKNYATLSRNVGGWPPTFTSRPKLCISLIRTLKDSGVPASSELSPLTIDSYIRVRPCTSSDLTVSSSCKVYAAPYASRAQTSISPKRWPPYCALPPSGC